MDRSFDPRNVFSAMHQRVTGELLHLMDGFYSNIEDGLFELAYRNDHQQVQRRCFDLMREMRYRRGNLIQTFAKRMQRNMDGWFSGTAVHPNLPPGAELLARKMSEKCTAHFRFLLQDIAERTNYGSNQNLDSEQLPIGPYAVSLCFVASCRSLEFDKQAIDIVQDLFGRFVLDRMGTIYGECNQRLEEAGFHNIRELTSVSSA